jgi:hypothetical protein
MHSDGIRSLEFILKPYQRSFHPTTTFGSGTTPRSSSAWDGALPAAQFGRITTARQPASPETDTADEWITYHLPAHVRFLLCSSLARTARLPEWISPAWQKVASRTVLPLSVSNHRERTCIHNTCAMRGKEEERRLSSLPNIRMLSV